MKATIISAASVLALSVVLSTAVVEAAEQQAQAGTSAAAASSGLSQEGRDFITESAKGNAGEVKLGKTAAEKGAAPAVRDYGERLATDHGKANDQLRKVAEEAKVDWPESVTEEQRKLMDELSKLDGAAFDKRFMEAMVKDHEKDIKKYEKMDKNAQYPPLKSYVEGTLPKLKEHLKRAQEVDKSLQGKPSA